MEGKNVLVTGATSGIGFYTARALALKGARVIVTGRNEERGREAVAEIRRHVGHDRVDFITADHSTVAGNRDLAKKVSGQLDHLDVLVNNVGGMYSQRRESEDGIEYTLAMNFIGPFTLTDELLPVLRGSSRIINAVSSAFEMWKQDPLEDLEGKEPYVGIQAYAHAKLLNILWTLALARKLGEEGTDITVNAVNPGMAWTQNTRSITPEAVPAWKFFWPIVRWMQRRASAETASRSAIFLASSDEVADVSGEYFESNGKRKRPSPTVLDADHQEHAYQCAERLVLQASKHA
ncbi:MAG TPA: SDR family NAD(P)-dependent oxidoreductase [Bacillales bacterium]